MKTFNEFLKKIFFQTPGTDSDFSRRPQTYDITQSVALQAFDEIAADLILPVPASGDGQEVSAQSPQDLRFDPVYENNYEVVPFKLSKGGTLNIERKYEIKRQPMAVSAGNFDLAEYKISRVLDAKYLADNRFVKPSLPEVKKAVEDIAQKHKKLGLALSAVNHYVISALRYGNPQNGLYSAEEALRGQPVDCGGYDTLFASVALALGIPARIVSGFWLGYDKNDMHAWVEIQLPDGRWMPADPSVEALREAGRTKKSGVLGYIGSDRAAFSYGCDIKLEARNSNSNSSLPLPNPARNQGGDQSQASDAAISVDIFQMPFVWPKSEQVKISVRNKIESRLI